MAATSRPGDWIVIARSQLESSQEWKAFTTDLFYAVQQLLSESHVSSFTDLSEDEKNLILERASKTIHTGSSYKVLMDHINSILEEQLSTCISQERKESNILKPKSQMILSHVYDAMVSLLEKSPHMKSKLHDLFNNPLPSDLRGIAWKLFLSNIKVRMEYLTRVSDGQSKSVIDTEISLHCQSLLSSQSTFQHLKENKWAELAMSTVMSYYHKYQNMKISLQDSDYLLVIPLLQNAVENSTQSSSLDSLSVTLVEEYITLMESRPHYMRTATSRNMADYNIFQFLLEFIEMKDEELKQVLQNVYSHEGEQPQDALLRGIKTILVPAVQTLFVGLLQARTVMYIWDQYIIGLDEPSYDCIPTFSLAFLLLLRKDLLLCQSPGDVEAVLRSCSPALSVQEFQSIINQHFYEELFGKLNKQRENTVPILDPTHTSVSPWNHLANRPAPASSKAQDRRQARMQREELRNQYILKMKEEERLRKQKEEMDARQKEMELQKLRNETLKVHQEKSSLEEKLLQERHDYYNMQRNAEEEISKLQAEIARLQDLKRPSFDAVSLESLAAPPPSRASNNPSHTEQQTVVSEPAMTSTVLNSTVPKDTQRSTAERLTIDLLKNIIQAADAIANGQSPAERDTLNALTRQHLLNYDQDLKNAELELFGQPLDPEELNMAPEPKKTEVKRKLSVTVQRATESRYRAQILKDSKNNILLKSISYLGTS
ncbi:uncharacterized protein LOC122787678 [Protopterus annectens]|uniref:uncharacterized protein LOC122787678 n=1 Tax=Protopterus annectens TaxID=7888 RepID=UPI001CFBA1FF|nr:uncharacterized protein LOC122787678 [Protopterus annectens]